MQRYIETERQLKTLLAEYGFSREKTKEAVFNLAGFAKTLLKMQMELKYGRVKN